MFYSWLRSFGQHVLSSLFSKQVEEFSARSRRIDRRLQSATESLEVRMLLSGNPITVSTLLDAGAGSLRDAIAQANLDTAGDTIQFAPALFSSGQLQTIHLSQALSIDNGMRIVGPGSNLLKISGDSATSLIFVDFKNHNANDNVIISGMQLTDAKSTSLDGGAIFNYGNLTLQSVTLTNDSAARNGGAIENFGSLNLLGDTFNLNVAGLKGGAIDNNGIVTSYSSTYEGNLSAYNGGAINNPLGSVLATTNDTIALNMAEESTTAGQ